ncbi:DUF3445 domain-containing protein [Candidatus Bathyarchaeota archaeon]|nr:DUF3445 domain-containing protein [Candidatus Bathyarchaeota archaeon]
MTCTRKRRYIHTSTVYGYLPERSLSVNKDYAYLLTCLPARYPTLFRLYSTTFENAITKASLLASLPIDPFAALRILAKVEDDLFLIVETPGGGLKCVAFICCFTFRCVCALCPILERGIVIR